jgi:rhodanese-related sulfurtransferase
MRFSGLMLCAWMLLMIVLPACQDGSDEKKAEPVVVVADDSLDRGLSGLDGSILTLDAASLRLVIQEAWETSGVREFKDLSEFVVVDVRDFEAYSNCRIRGAVNVELKDVEHEATRWDKDRRVVVYSHDEQCVLARKAALRLIARGFKKVFVFNGGMLEWKNKRFEMDGVLSMLPLPEES